MPSPIRHPDPITRLYRACNPKESLTKDDPRRVDCSKARGMTEYFAKEYLKSLRLSDPDEPDFKLFTGQMGVGKSSELLDLKARLEEPGAHAAPHVIYFDVSAEGSEGLDLEDLDLPELLIFIAGKIIANLRESNITGFTPINDKLRAVGNWLADTIPRGIELNEAEIDAGFIKFGVEIKNRADASIRRTLRDAVDAQSINLLLGLNQLLDDARAALIKHHAKDGIIIIVDGLEKMPSKILDDKGASSHERLFIDRSKQLTAIKARVIYTLPPELVYSPRGASLTTIYGESPRSLPMIRLRSCDETAIDVRGDGMNALREIFVKRCRYADVDPAAVFASDSGPARPSDLADNTTLNHLLQMSGGHPRHLLIFIQDALSAIDDFPITREIIDRTIQRYANAIGKTLTDIWPHLAPFKDTCREMPASIPYEIRSLLLQNHFILEYYNGAPWYEINPAIRLISRYARL